MKKIISIALLLVMMMSLCACGGTNNTVAENEQKPADEVSQQKNDDAQSSETIPERGSRSNPYSFDEAISLTFVPSGYDAIEDALAEVTFNFKKYYSHEELVELAPDSNWDKGEVAVLISADYTTNFDDSEGMSHTAGFSIVDDSMKEHNSLSTIPGQFSFPQTVYGGGHYDYLLCFVEDYSYKPKYIKIEYAAPSDVTLFGYESQSVWVDIAEVASASNGE